MSDYDFPELPSDEELGITDEDREKYGEDLPADGPEMSDAKLAALLGEPSPPKKSAAGTPAIDQQEARNKAARAVHKAEKKQSKDEKKATRAAAREAKAERKEEARRAKEDARRQRTEAREKAAEAAAAVPSWHGPVTLVLLLLFGAFSSTRTGLPAPAPANAPDTAFSSARAMVTLVDLAREAHPTGSPDHARVRGLIVDRLADLGIESEIQTTTTVLARPRARLEDGGVQILSDFSRAATVRNIVARIPGTAPTGTLLITAHYDSREVAVGAADDGSGVVTILETVRAIRAGDPLRNDLILLFTDAEELGLLGARAFVDQHRWMADVDLVLSFEMRGGGGPSVMFETNENNGWVIEALAEFDPAPAAYSLAYEVYKRMPNDTDFTPFREAGVQGMNFAGIDNAHVYHQAGDTPDNMSERTLQHHGLHALSAVRWLGDADLSSVDAPNRAYISVPGVGLIHYPAPAVHALSALLVLLFLLLAGVARRGGARPQGIAAGLATTVLLLGFSFLMANALLDQLRSRHPEAGTLHGSLFHGEGWYMLSVAFAVLAMTVGVVGIVRRWVGRDEMAVGALVLPVVGAVAFGIVAPLGAVHLQIPALAAVLAVVVGSLLRDRVTGFLGWAVSVTLALPVFIVLQPVIELVWMALTLQLLGVLAALMALGFAMSLPALDALRTPNPWWAPASAAAAAAAFLAIGVLTSGPSPARPLPSTLLYAYEHGSGEALWVTASVDEAVPGQTEARAWAEERAGGAFDQSRDLEGFGYWAGVVPVRPAPVVNAAPPTVEVLVDSIVGSERQVRLGVRSEVGAERLGFWLVEGTRLRAINEVPLEDADGMRRVDHWGEPVGSVFLDLTMPADEAIGLHVIEHLFRPEEVLGDGAFDRPANMAPNVNRMSDRAMFRYSVAAFVDPRHGFLRPTGRPDTGVPPDTLVVRPSGDSMPDSGAVRDSGAVSDSGAVDLVDTVGAVDTTTVAPLETEATDSMRPSGGGSQ
jgi:hypothetical protein